MFEKKNRSLSAISAEKQSVSHRALTGYIKRRCPDPSSISRILSECDVSGRIGALPPELRGQVDSKDLAHVTTEFTNILTPFLERKMNEFDRPVTITYSLPTLNELFGTPCRLSLRAETPYTDGWSGTFGCVIKMTLPKLQAEYALKVFYNTKIRFQHHGPRAEVITAFAANKAEAKDNNSVYLAYWGNVSYMLSRWGGDDADNCPYRHNENQIFLTSYKEHAPRNYRKGKRIDFGDTGLTPYGLESYAVRKLYRQIVYVCRQKDPQGFRKIYNDVRSYCMCENLKRATKLINLSLPYKDMAAFETFNRMRIMEKVWQKKQK